MDTLARSAGEPWSLSGPAAFATTSHPSESHRMFIFKAAVVGAGTMGGQIAQTIAASGIPVLLKDIKQEFIDAGIKAAT